MLIGRRRSTQEWSSKVATSIRSSIAYMLQAGFRGKHLQRMMLVGGVMLFILYFAMVVIPTFNVARGAQTLIAQHQSAASPPAALAPAARPPTTLPTADRS